MYSLIATAYQASLIWATDSLSLLSDCSARVCPCMQLDIRALKGASTDRWHQCIRQAREDQQQAKWSLILTADWDRWTQMHKTSTDQQQVNEHKQYAVIDTDIGTDIDTNSKLSNIDPDRNKIWNLNLKCESNSNSLWWLWNEGTLNTDDDKWRERALDPEWECAVGKRDSRTVGITKETETKNRQTEPWPTTERFFKIIKSTKTISDLRNRSRKNIVV